MTEYSSIRTSSWDVDAMVTQLNERASHGWTVVSIVNTGGELAAILQRSTNGSGPSGGSGPAVVSAAAGTAGAAQAAAAGTAGAAQAAAAVEPVAVAEVVAAAAADPVGAISSGADDAAGWAARAESAVARAESAAEAVVEPVGWAAQAESEVSSVAAEPVAPMSIGASEAAVIEPVIQAAPLSVTPAGWYPDPSGRFEMRYWDGTAWTEHVARGGQQYTDPPIA
jgi:hypothetical protein